METIEKLDWIATKGYTIVVRPLNLDPPRLNLRLEKSQKLFFQVVTESVSIGIDDLYRQVLKARSGQ